MAFLLLARFIFGKIGGRKTGCGIIGQKFFEEGRDRVCRLPGRALLVWGFFDAPEAAGVFHLILGVDGGEELSRFVIHQIGHGEIEALVAEVEPWKVAETSRHFEADPLDGKGPVASALRS
jgi:hypothetical protein